jgi:hypothetical protein
MSKKLVIIGFSLCFMISAMVLHHWPHPAEGRDEKIRSAVAEEIEGVLGRHTAQEYLTNKEDLAREIQSRVRDRFQQ